MKVVYMGTPDFAVGPLQAMLSGGVEVLAVVTQPDRPKGRSKELMPSPVKVCAMQHQIPVLQPERIKRPEAVAELKQYDADLFVVAAFGQILSKEILEMPRLGCINIHASLLPKYRGAAPIQWSIIDGEKETGVTIMQMNEGLDTGDILTQKIVPITAEDTGESLFDKLCEAGGQLLLETLPKLENGSITPVKQDESKSSYAKMLTKELGHIDFSGSAVEIERLIRGLNSWPSAYTKYEGKTLKIWKSRVAQNSEKEQQQKPGTIVRVTDDSIYVQTGNGVLELLEVQLEGKKRMQVKDFLLGHRPQAGTVLG